MGLEFAATITICHDGKEQGYQLVPLADDSLIHWHAFLLRKNEWEIYKVVQYPPSRQPPFACSCPSGIFRPLEACRHVQALRTLGFFKE